MAETKIELLHYSSHALCIRRGAKDHSVLADVKTRPLSTWNPALNVIGDEGDDPEAVGDVA